MKRKLSFFAGLTASFLVLPAFAAPVPSTVIVDSTQVDAQSVPPLKLTPQQKKFYDAAVAQAEKDLKANMEAMNPYYNNLGGDVVRTSPYLGVHSALDGSDLITNFSAEGTDVQLLRQRAIIANRLKQQGISVSDHPRLDISGDIQVQASDVNQYTHTNVADINLTNAELDLVVEGPQWITGYMNLVYDDSVEGTTPNVRTANSNVYVDRAFVTIGDLNQSPLFGTAGQIYAPFGTYDSYLITDPTTEILGETKVRALELGLAEGGFEFEPYVYKPNTSPGDIEDGWGLNVSYQHPIGSNGMANRLGVSYIADLSSSDGLQFSSPGFNELNHETMVHHVPGVDVRDVFTIQGRTAIAAELVAATRHFDDQDVSFNDQGEIGRASCRERV